MLFGMIRIEPDSHVPDNDTPAERFHLAQGPPDQWFKTNDQ
jgi:hypothetical protein